MYNWNLPLHYLFVKQQSFLFLRLCPVEDGIAGNHVGHFAVACRKNFLLLHIQHTSVEQKPRQVNFYALLLLATFFFDGATSTVVFILSPNAANASA